MKVAITAQGPNLTDEIDPRFDRAKYLVVVDTDTEQCVAYGNMRYIGIGREVKKAWAQRLVDLGIEVLVTGSIHEEILAALQVKRIQVRTTVGGFVKDALGAFKAIPRDQNNRLNDEKYYWA